MKSLGNLKVDFFESGIGDTIIVTFPNGGLGVIDGHPSPSASRPDLLSLVAGKKIHFICLTHPHADHGADLVSILQEHADVGQFWHTVDNVPQFLFGVEQTTNFPSPVREFAAQMNRDWANFLENIFASVAQRDLPESRLRSDLQATIIDDVEIHCLSPDEQILNEFSKAYREKLTDPKKKVPDPNLLSAILGLKCGDGLILLGADALKVNWEGAMRQHFKRGLPKAVLLKVPHHGARNSFEFQGSKRNYLDLCAKGPTLKTVLFAGDSKHPDPDVYTRLRRDSQLYCLSNGRKSPPANPLKIRIPGARAVAPAPVCNPVLSFEMDWSGALTVTRGHSCEGCAI